MTSRTMRWRKNPYGNLTRYCLLCQSARERLKYRTDAAYREKAKARQLARYYASKGDQHV